MIACITKPKGSPTQGKPQPTEEESLFLQRLANLVQEYGAPGTDYGPRHFADNANNIGILREHNIVARYPQITGKIDSPSFLQCWENLKNFHWEENG